MADFPNHELLTLPEVAKLLRITEKAARAALERGQIPGVVRLGRRVRFRAVDLRRHLGLL